MIRERLSKARERAREKVQETERKTRPFTGYVAIGLIVLCTVIKVASLQNVPVLSAMCDCAKGLQTAGAIAER